MVRLFLIFMALGGQGALAHVMVDRELMPAQDSPKRVEKRENSRRQVAQEKEQASATETATASVPSSQSALRWTLSGYRLYEQTLAPYWRGLSQWLHRMSALRGPSYCQDWKERLAKSHRRRNEAFAHQALEKLKLVRSASKNQVASAIIDSEHGPLAALGAGPQAREFSQKILSNKSGLDCALAALGDSTRLMSSGLFILIAAFLSYLGLMLLSRKGPTWWRFLSFFAIPVIVSLQGLLLFDFFFHFELAPLLQQAQIVFLS